MNIRMYKNKVLEICPTPSKVSGQLTTLIGSLDNG